MSPEAWKEVNIFAFLHFQSPHLEVSGWFFSRVSYKMPEMGSGVSMS